MRRRHAVFGLLAAGLAMLGCVLSWLSAERDVVVAPVLPGEPATMSTLYYAPLLVLSLVLAAAAGVLAVVSVAALRRHSPAAE